MNSHLKNLAIKAARNIDLVYQGDAYPRELTRLIVNDLVQEFSKLKWVGDNENSNKVIKAVQQELKQRYNN